MNAIEKLAQMGCGSEILNSQKERSDISCTIYNAKNDFKYLNYALKTGLYNLETVTEKKAKLLDSLKNIEHLVIKYATLYSEQFYKLKLSIEKQTKP